MTLQYSKVLFTFSTLVLWTAKSFGHQPKILWRPSQIVVEQWHSVCVCYYNIYFTLNKDGLILSHNLGHIYLAHWQWTWEQFGTFGRVILCAVCTLVFSSHYQDAKRTWTRGLAQVSIRSKQLNPWFSFKCRPHFNPGCQVRRSELWHQMKGTINYNGLGSRAGPSWNCQFIIIVFIVVVILPSHACVLIVLMVVLHEPHFTPSKQTDVPAQLGRNFDLSYEVHQSVCSPADRPHEKPACFSAHCDDECLN